MKLCPKERSPTEMDIEEKEEEFFKLFLDENMVET